VKATLINETGVFDAILACLSENDLAALREKTFADESDAFDAILACLSENDLTAMETVYVPWLVTAREKTGRSSEPKRDQKLVQDLSSICNALRVVQARRDADTGRYEW